MSLIEYLFFSCQEMSNCQNKLDPNRVLYSTDHIVWPRSLAPPRTVAGSGHTEYYIVLTTSCGQGHWHRRALQLEVVIQVASQPSSVQNSPCDATISKHPLIDEKNKGITCSSIFEKPGFLKFNINHTILQKIYNIINYLLIFVTLYNLLFDLSNLDPQRIVKLV